MQATELSFEASAERGNVSALLLEPDDSRALLVFGHGAGANMRHAHMQAIAESLARVGIATLRFNFPYMEAGGGRTDSNPVCVTTIGNAIALARSLRRDTRLLLGGHSFGGRMASHYAASSSDIDAMVYYSFPLHPAGKPATGRAAHLPSIRVPQLFLSGTRDALADLELLRGVVGGLDRASLHEVDTADHGFRILKRSRKSAESVYDEAARVVAGFLDQLTDAR